MEDDIQQIFNIILGQCTLEMEQALEAIPNYKILKEEADSVALFKAIKKNCYNYQPHEYPALGAWDVLDKLSKTTHPENVSKSDHYESMKTMVEVRKASGINFVVLCIHKVDIVMKVLHS